MSDDFGLLIQQVQANMSSLNEIRVQLEAYASSVGKAFASFAPLIPALQACAYCGIDVTGRAVHGGCGVCKKCGAPFITV